MTRFFKVDNAPEILSLKQDIIVKQVSVNQPDGQPWGDALIEISTPLSQPGLINRIDIPANDRCKPTFRTSRVEKITILNRKTKETNNLQSNRC